MHVAKYGLRTGEVGAGRTLYGRIVTVGPPSQAPPCRERPTCGWRLPMDEEVPTIPGRTFGTLRWVTREVV